MKLKDKKRINLQLEAITLVGQSDKINKDTTLLPGIRDKKLYEISKKLFKIKRELEKLNHGKK